MNPDWDARLQLMWDRQEIERVLYTYCRGVDRGDSALLKTVYHVDGVDNHGHFNGNAHEFADFIVERMATLVNYGQHLVTNTLIEVDGDRASSESGYIGFHKVPGGWDSVASYFGQDYATKAKADGTLDGEHEFNCGGRYLDEFERRDGTWRILVRRITVEWNQCGPMREIWAGGRSVLDLPSQRNGSDPVYQLPLVAPHGA